MRLPAVSQNRPDKDFILSAHGHYGFILSHRNNMANLIKGHVVGGEVNYLFRTNGNKPWQQLYKYPDFGICVLHLDLANPEQLGTFEAVYPYTNLRLNKLNSKVNFNLRLGAGLAFITKPFDRITNHKNNTIGSHLNGFVNLRLSATYMITDAWAINTGIGLTHASNGAMKTPNLGLNIATLNVGIGYAFGNRCYEYRRDSLAPCPKVWKVSVIGVTGVKELEQPGGRKYMAFGLQTIAYRTLNYKNKLGGGIEVTYNNSTKREWLADSVYHPTFDQIIQGGAKVCYAFVLDRLSFPVEFGVYIYKKQKVNGMFFHRIGLRYMLTKHVIANVTLLTHFAKADYFEGGFGYEF
ncbi:MAG TPA: acyloxyacyl hydrolase [Bacteroidia bacterium]|nr:acyloxyacyl hydrolase [Bacteroidia bacterium]